MGENVDHIPGVGGRDGGAGGAVDHGGLPGRVVAHLQAEGLAHGPDGHVGGTVVGEHVHGAAVDVGGGELLSVDQHLHAGEHLDGAGAAGGQGGGAQAQAQGQGDGQNTG